MKTSKRPRAQHIMGTRDMRSSDGPARRAAAPSLVRARIARFLRGGLVILGLVSISQASCTEATPDYCDANTPCALPGTTCDVPHKICVPSEAGLGEGGTGRPNGSPCTSAPSCASQACVDGVCCATSSCPTCEACNIPGHKGTCHPVDDGTPCGTETSCKNNMVTVDACKASQCQTTTQSCAPYACDSSGSVCAKTCEDDSTCGTTGFCEKTSGTCQPKKGNGVSCEAGNQCQSGTCTAKEKVCCDTLCDGACETCTGKNQCTPLPKDTPCVGAEADSCKDDTAGGSSTLTLHRCDGIKATCPEVPSTCDPYRCDKSAKVQCATRCQDHSDCQSHICQLWDSPQNTCVKAQDVCYVDASATTGGKGSLSAPYGTISACLSHMSNKSPIIAIANGTYTEDLTITTKATLVGYATPPTLGLAFADFLVQVVIKPPAQGILIKTTDPVRIVGVQVRGNASVYYLISGLGITLRLERAVLANCLGAGIYTTNNGTITLRQVSITGCQSAGLITEFSNLDLGQVTIHGNPGAGIYFEDGTLRARDLALDLNAGDGLITKVAKLDLDRVRVFANRGIGLWLLYDTTGTAFNLGVANNAKEGILQDRGSHADIHMSTLVNNNGAGPQIVCDSNVIAHIDNSIIWAGTTWSINSQAPFSGNCIFTYCNLNVTPSGVGHANTLVAVPLFVNPSPLPGILPDYRLQSGSPCVDGGRDSYPAGITLPTKDLAGNKRNVKVGTTNNSLDIGAFERQSK